MNEVISNLTSALSFMCKPVLFIIVLGLGYCLVDYIRWKYKKEKTDPIAEPKDVEEENGQLIIKSAQIVLHKTREQSLKKKEESKESESAESCDPDTATVSVDPGTCKWVGSELLTSITVTINGDATVTITGPGGPYEFASSGSVNVGPGSYSWTAVPGEGQEIVGPSSGQFTTPKTPRILGSVKRERTGKSFQGLYLTQNNRNIYEASKVRTLVIQFDLGCFVFENPMKIDPSKIEELVEILRGAKEEGKLDFKWGEYLLLRILPEDSGRYEAVVKGEYPHLVQEATEVILILAELREPEGEKDKICLFEIVLRGGVIWQEAPAYFWSGDIKTGEELAFYQEYFKKKVRKVRVRQNNMRT